MCMKTWSFWCLLFMFCYLVLTMEAVVQVKEAIPMTTLSPPEGNTTFLDATSTWCVALPGVSQVDLQRALDWACGQGMVDCDPIKSGGRCFGPDTIVSHASFAFNAYFQQNGNSDIACNFGGTATLTKKNPSYGKCFYASSGNSGSSAAAPLPRAGLTAVWGSIGGIILFWYSRCSY